MTSDTSVSRSVGARTSAGSTHQPAALRRLTFAATHAADAEAMVGVNGPVSFRELHRRVTVAATTLTARGVDPTPAVRATVTALLPRTGTTPAQLAATAGEVLADLERRIGDVLGAGDVESLPGLFRVSARRRPDAVALTDLHGATITYRDLDDRTERLARALAVAGAGPETLVGVAMPRSADLVVALLAVLKTGAAYLPLDRTHPIARLRTIVDDAAPVLVLADPETAAAWSDMSARISTPDDLTAWAEPLPATGLPERVGAHSSAYVMYTSGSTGVPKGVVVTHDNVISLIVALDALVESTPDDVWSMFHSYAFDVSVGEIWAALLAGGRLVVLDHATTRAPDDVVEVFDREGVTIVNFTPSSFYQFAAAVRPPHGSALPESVRRLHFSGELLDYEHVRKWQADRTADGSPTRPGADVPGPQLNNMYGPTETTVYMTRRDLTCEFVETATASDIGAPLLGSRVHVLDGRLAPLPDGVPGELYVSGVQVTRGFLRRHGLTATRYIADPFGPPGSRMYRTGDIGVARNGSIEFVGRRDGQVKLRGFRIELGEVESAMSAVDGIDAAGADIRMRGDTEHLVGYLVPTAGRAPDEATVRARLTTALPEYMVPTLFVWLDALPLTVNGKLDRALLPEPDATDETETAEPPATPTEERLAALVAEILGETEIGVTASLFDLGGNSLTATRVAARAAEDFGTTVAARDLFTTPSVRGLATVIDQRLAEGDEQDSARPPLRPVERTGPLPLSPAQRRIWFLETMNPGGPAYLIPAVLRLRCRSDAGLPRPCLEPSSVAAALDDLIARHETLRTRFVAVEGVPQQVIDDPETARHDARVDPPIDMRGSGSAGVTATVADIVTRGFDLEQEAPVRARLIRVADDEWVLVLVVHHIIGDGGSMAPLVADFVEAYQANQAGRAPEWSPLPVHYADYAVWHHEILGDSTDPESLAARQLAYWRKQLADVPELTDLPLDRPRAAMRDESGAELSTAIDATTWSRLRELADRHDATMFMCVHALLAVTLLRSGSSADLVIGTPVEGRGDRRLDGLIGMFVNTLALRTPLRRDADFAAVLTACREIDIAALDHADLPFETVVEEVTTARSTAHPPLFQVALAFQNTDRPTVELPGLVVTELEAPVTSAKVDLQVTVVDPPGRPRDEDTPVVITYATALFDAGTVADLARRLLSIAHAVVESPQTPIGDLSTGEPDGVPALVSSPGLAASAVTLPGLLDAAVARNPHGVAVTDGDHSLTYAELDAATRLFAAELRSRGARPGVVVALAVPRSLSGTVAFWAIARTGAAVGLIDPSQPGERTRYMTGTLSATLGVTSSATGLDDGTTWLLVDDLLDLTDPTRWASRPVALDDSVPDALIGDTAYVIFTSGSTGRPKGVAVTHRGFADLVADARSRFDLGPESRVLRFAAPGFDASVFETLVAVAEASTMVVVPSGVTGGRELATVIAGESVSHMTITPSALATVPAAEAFPDLRVVCVAGDACSPELVRAWSDGRAMYNLYGPTEATIWSTASAAMRPGLPVTIGGPIAGVGVLVLDARLHPVPPGVAGELYLVGPALAAGYLNQTALTAERFVAAPFGRPGDRMYRTGDLVRRRRRDGRWELDFLGRSDFQVKIRGFRIETGEIDAVLEGSAGVDFSTTAGIAHPTSGETVLVSWVHGTNGAAVDVPALTAHAARHLPAHMVPTAIVPLDEIPLAATGKLDRAALPAPEFSRGVHIEPRTDTERAVAAVFAEVLGMDGAEDGPGVSALDSFFDLGGTSLSATRVVARLGAEFGVEIGVRVIFEAPTVEALASLLDTGELDGRATGPAPGVVPRPAPVPLSYAQRRMWFLNQFDPGSAAYVIPIVVRLHGDLDVDAMHEAINEVAERHEVLRTIYPTGPESPDAEPVQVVRASHPGLVPVGHTVISGIASDGLLAEEITATISQPFDVTRDLPVRARILSSSDTDHVLVIALHHIAADGESAPILAREVVEAYDARRSGRAPRWTPLTLQYADYAVWQRHRLGEPADPDSEMSRQLSYWRQQLRGLPDVLPLPLDRPRTLGPDARAATVRWSLPAAVVAGLRRRASEQRATLFMVLHTAVAAVLARLTSTAEIAVATPVAGRGHRVLDELIGMFVNTVVLRVDVDPQLTGGALLDRVKLADVAAFDHSEVPFERVVDAVDPPRTENVEPMAQVMLVHTAGAEPVMAGVTMDDLSAEFVEIDDTTAKFDLTIGTREGVDGKLAGSITYATALFDQETAETIASALQSTLTVLADDLDVPVADIPLLTDVQEQTQYELGLGRVVPLPPATLVDAVVAGSRISPDAVALRCAGRSITHREFAARVAVIARELIAAGVGPEDSVAVSIPRSVELVVAIHAVLAAGGQYVPVATDAPVDRVRYMIDTAGADIGLVARGAGAGPVTADDTTIGGVVDRVIVVDSTIPVDLDTAPVADAERRTPLLADHAAYTLFTSGSMGRPKGVTVTHRAVMNRLDWGIEEFGIGPDDAVLLKTPATFDVSVPELFAPPMTGARMVIAPDDAHLDPHAIARLIDDEQVSTVHFVPSLLTVFVEVLEHTAGGMLPSLRHLYCSGEALAPATLAEVRAVLPRVQVHNLFGPTEAAVEVTAATLGDHREVVPMGRPIWNTQGLVLDGRLRPVPAGVAGELYLGGVQLARGYAARADLTADRFVADPYGHGGRLYRTGDLVRRNRSGELEYLGRSDFQVKLRGQRIELGEIESVLATVSGVRQAAVTLTRAPGGAEHLVGYLIGPESADSLGRAREAVAGALPAYMRPTLWVTLTDAPLSSAGKLDRKALPAPHFDMLVHTESDAEPATDTERVVEGIVAAVLGVEHVPMTSSFFALGGDSIASIRLTSMLRAAGFNLTPRDVFGAATVRELAQLSRHEPRAVLDELPGGGTGPVAPTPGAAWMLDLADGVDDIADFSQSTVLTLPADIDEHALRAVIVAVVAAHPMLTASLQIAADGEPVVTAGAGSADDAVVEILDHSGPVSDSAAATLDESVRAAHRRALGTLSPERGRLVAAVGVRVADGRDTVGRLVIAIHHLGVDAVSWPTIVSGLARAWWQYRNGDEPHVTARGTSFRRWAQALSDLADRDHEIDWWTDQLPPATASVLDPVRDRLRTGVSATHFVDSDRTETVLGRVADAFGARPDTVLAAALAHALATGPAAGRLGYDAPTVSMLLENHGREESVAPGADLSETVGWFTSFVPVGVDIPRAGTYPGRDLATILKSLKDRQKRMPDNGIAFGALRWSRPGSPLRDRPLPPVTVNYLGSLAGSDDDADTAATEFLPAGDAPALPPSVTGDMTALAALTATMGVVPSPQGRSLRLDLTAPAAVLGRDVLHDVASRWDAALSSLAAYVESVGDPGPSETDVIGGGLSQTEIDDLVGRYSAGRSHTTPTIWPPTPLQQGLVYEAERLAGTARFDGAAHPTDPYVTQSIIEFAGDHAPTALLPAIRELLARQRVLRSAFTRTASGRPVVVIPPGDHEAATDPDFRGIDLTGADVADAAERIAELAEEDRTRPFHLDTPPLIRFTAVSHGSVDGPAHTVVITAHHIILDGWSGPILVADLLAAHLGRPAVTPAADMETYLEWLDRRDRAAAVTAWQDVLADVAPTLVAPHHVARARQEERRPYEIAVRLDAVGRSRLEERVRQLGSTTSTALHAAWSILLSRLTGERRVVFGETVSGRPADLDGADAMIGLFINTVPVVADVDPDRTVAELVTTLHESRTGLVDHQFLGLGEITRATGHPALFDTLVVYESYPVDTGTVLEGSRTSGLEIRDVTTSDATHYPLALIAAPDADELSLTVKADLTAVDAEIVEVIASSLVDLLQTLADDPATPVAALDPMPAEMRGTVEAWSRGAMVELGWGGRSVGSVVAERVGLSGSQVAVWCGDRVVSYGEFGGLVAGVARRLLGLGVGVDSAVGVVMSRSLELLVAVHAVVVVGGRYVPVEEDAPVERVGYMLSTAGVGVVLTRVSEEVVVPSGVECVVVDCGVGSDVWGGAGSVSGGVGGLGAVVDEVGVLSPLVGVYTLFTSGSTGRPKGVTVSHGAVVNRLGWMQSLFGVSAGDVVLWKTPVSFDVSVWELFWPLMVGASVVVAEPGGHRDPWYVASVVERFGVSVCHFVPSMLSVFVDALQGSGRDLVGRGDSASAGLGSLRQVFCSGEALGVAGVEGLRGLVPGVRVVNLYGPTEAAVDVTSYVV
ncbi:amino acid adenylation domain-containing protein [Gordonia alkanivorans]|uniref:non-ribosomal peptide synthetase n=1 Tax=Gordonia alkanivorans TaxID=84096 RepID=UPI00244CE0E2|nr:non-ribosomal peptide synthetase [Gordonia alkanivorans]MDH3026640.1 amino acid adenylation domain-containing protein [Gordonia alkanivorans]